MIPNTDQALRNLAQRLMVSLLPEFSSEYAVADGATLGILINVIADEVTEGIQKRVEDIDDMERLLSGCALDENEAAVLQASLASYSLRDVNDRHDALTRILIDWHERAELDDTLAALDQEIWQYLKRHAARHTITAIPEL